MNLQNIKLEAPAFDGKLDPQNFLDWKSDMDIISTDIICLIRDEFVKIKLIGHARQYLTYIEKLMTRGDEPVQTWDKMKLKLQEKYLPVSYK